jgi:hypothetical protein
MKPIDYDYWFRFDYWSHEQAAYLLSNINPDDKAHIALLHEPKYQRIHGDHFGSINTFKKILQLIQGTDFSKYDSQSVQDGKISLSTLFKFAKYHNLGRFPCRLVWEWERSIKNPDSQSRSRPDQNISAAGGSEDGYFGQQTADAFDPLPISGIASLFSTGTPYDSDHWKKLASRAKRNGLGIARTETNKGSGESTFNPVLVANWLISKGQAKSEHLRRILRKNLPERSRDQMEDIFGIE